MTPLPLQPLTSVEIAQAVDAVAHRNQFNFFNRTDQIRERNLAMALHRYAMKMSYPEIAKTYSLKSHSSAIRSIKIAASDPLWLEVLAEADRIKSRRSTAA